MEALDALTPRLRNTKDLWAGVLYLGFGAGAVWLARDYAMGSALRMGPGYFPTVLGALLMLVGLSAVVRAFLAREDRVGALALRPLLIVIGSTFLFALLVRNAGLAVAVPLFALLGATASRKFRLVPSLVLAAGLTVFCVLVFVKGLGIPLPILGPWFGD